MVTSRSQTQSFAAPPFFFAMNHDAAGPAQPESPRPATVSRLRLPREIGIIGALLLMLLILSLFIPQFRDIGNVINITRNFSVVSIWGMTAVVTAALISNGWSVFLAVPAGLMAAAAIGLLNGLCITRLNM